VAGKPAIILMAGKTGCGDLLFYFIIIII